MKETVLNEYKLQIPARSENEGVARAMICAIASLMDPTLGDLADIRCAVSEAVTNAIVHGYRNQGGTVYLTVKLYKGGVIQIEVTDRGCGIADVEEAMRPLYTTDRAGERSGMGFSVMQTFMDSLRVESHLGKGTRVLMRKRLSGEHEGR
jgi:stage II sporulation protein AB (anti-sigma F factor)